MSNEPAQDIEGIIRAVVKQRASQRGVLLARRLITVKVDKDDFRINRHEVFINPGFVLAGDPVVAVDKILDGITSFDDKFIQERAQRLNTVKSDMLKWAGYLERTLSKKEYLAFIGELIPSSNGDGPHEQAEAEGERFLDKGIPFAP